MEKKAYPTGFSYPFIEQPADLNKWTQTMNQLYLIHQKTGEDFNKLFDKITQGWDPVEKFEFKNWMSFYQSGAHKAYKTAQYHGSNPFEMLKATMPKPNLQEYPIVQNIDQAAEIDKKIRAIIGRLTAAEKLATDPNVQVELQKRLDMGIKKWLEELHEIKRQVQLAPIRNIRSSILEDLIIKRARFLKKQGFVKAAQVMESFAQQQNLPPGPSSQVPETPDQNPSSTPLSPLPDNSSSDGSEALDALIEGMNDANDVNDNDDDLIVDIEDDPISRLHVIAQELPAIPPNDLTQTVIPEPSNITENPIKVPEEIPILPKNDDDIFEDALANVTIADAIKKFEAIANVLRTREIPRQISHGDLILDRLGILSFFPSLGEALSKTLESNQYALTRIEDILSKLRGAIQTPKESEINLKNDQVPPEELMAIRNKLQQEEDLEKAKKEKRKQDEIVKTLGPEVQTPITNVQESLEKPVALPQPPPPPPAV